MVCSSSIFAIIFALGWPWYLLWHIIIKQINKIKFTPRMSLLSRENRIRITACSKLGYFFHPTSLPLRESRLKQYLKLPAFLHPFLPSHVESGSRRRQSCIVFFMEIAHLRESRAQCSPNWGIFVTQHLSLHVESGVKLHLKLPTFLHPYVSPHGRDGCNDLQTGGFMSPYSSPMPGV